MSAFVRRFERDWLANENRGHRRGFVGELSGKDDVAGLQCVFGLLNEAARRDRTARGRRY